MTINLFCGPTTEAARELVHPYVRDEYFAYAEYPQLAFQRERFDFMWANRFVIGSPDDVAAKLQEYVDLGVNHFIARCSWIGFPHEHTMESLRLFSKEVVPRFATNA
jgi:alkanesulfonate monooxygenase SsuD/methylene tetrahydromethanopterin reductase-like flavin-dependent oxidoreductase (luciferase family)